MQGRGRPHFQKIFSLLFSLVLEINGKEILACLVAPEYILSPEHGMLSACIFLVLSEECWQDKGRLKFLSTMEQSFLLVTS